MPTNHTVPSPDPSQQADPNRRLLRAQRLFDGTSTVDVSSVLVEGPTIRAVGAAAEAIASANLLTCHVKAIIDQWPIENFHEQSVAWHDSHSVGGDVVARIDAMPALLAEEVTFWRGRRLHGERPGHWADRGWRSRKRWILPRQVRI